MKKHDNLSDIKYLLNRFDDGIITEKQLSFILLWRYPCHDKSQIDFVIYLVKSGWRRMFTQETCIRYFGYTEYVSEHVDGDWWFDPAEKAPCTPYKFVDAVVRQLNRDLEK